jgi:hypothetical protein
MKIAAILQNNARDVFGFVLLNKDPKMAVYV